MYGQVVVPDDKDGEVDWQDPQHDNEDAVRIVVEIPRRRKPFPITLKKPLVNPYIMPTGEAVLTCSLAYLNALIQVAICTMHATIYAN